MRVAGLGVYVALSLFTSICMLYAATTNRICHADIIHAHMRSQEYACAKCGTGESTALSLTFPSPRHDICRGGLSCKPMRRLRRMQHSYACARLARRPGRIRRRWWRERGRERPARGCTYGRAGEERMAAILAYCRRGGITSPATETARRVPSAVLASSTSVLVPASRLGPVTRRDSVPSTCHGELTLDAAAPDDPSPICPLSETVSPRQSPIYAFSTPCPSQPLRVSLLSCTFCHFLQRHASAASLSSFFLSYHAIYPSVQTLQVTTLTNHGE